MKKYLGFIVGFIFGLFAIVVPSMAFSRILDASIPFFVPMYLFVAKLAANLSSDSANLQQQANLFSTLLPIGAILNGLFFGLIGFLIQKYLHTKNKSEYIVIYIFAAIIVLFVLVGVLECVLVERCGAVINY